MKKLNKQKQRERMSEEIFIRLIVGQSMEQHCGIDETAMKMFADYADKCARAYFPEE